MSYLVRPPAVAGSFYPANPSMLRAALDDAFADARGDDVGALQPKAIVAPHAGYAYSGAIAASAYAAVSRPEAITRVVLLGPSHFVAFGGLAVSPADAFVTPLGEVAIDTEARERVASLTQVVVNEVPHADEHSLEVQVPFLQRQLGDAWTLLPLAVGFAEPDVVARVLDAVWGGEETLIVISTDLSHYLDAATARLRDRRTAEAILALDPAAVGDRDACGCRGLRGSLLAARERGMTAHLLDLRNSADTAGEPERVVGYGAFAFD